MQEKRRPRKPLQSLPASRKADLRRRLGDRERNLDWLLTFTCAYVRDFLMRAFPSADPRPAVAATVEDLGRSLAQAILDKLASYHPRDAQRGSATLLRYYPDQAGELVNQALCYLVDEWVRDFIASPSDTSLVRLVRLRPRMTALPSMRGRANIGNTYRLRCYSLYLEAYQKAKDVLGVKAWRAEDPYLEGEFLRDRTQKLARLFPDVQPSEREEWARLSPSEIAYRVAAKQTRELPGLTPFYLKRSLLPKMCRLARAIDAALAKQRTLPS
jgi:hypothetical protein